MNKIFRYAKIAIAALVTVAMGACTSDYEYDTPEALKGAQVYFSNTLPSKIEVNKESGNFDVTLSRQNTEGELTVPLMFTADEGKWRNESHDRWLIIDDSLYHCGHSLNANGGHKISAIALMGTSPESILSKVE